MCNMQLLDLVTEKPTKSIDILYKNTLSVKKQGQVTQVGSTTFCLIFVYPIHATKRYDIRLKPRPFLSFHIAI